MHSEEIKAKFTYNYDLDVANIEAKKDYRHKCSVELSFGVFLDFDVDNFPVNLEIVSLSKILGCEKDSLISPDGNVIITISDDLIKAEVIFKEVESVRFTTFNDLEIPSFETYLALV